MAYIISLPARRQYDGVVRIGLLFCLAIVPGCCSLAFAAGLQREDLRSVQEAFRKTDASLAWFEARAKESLDATRSVMIVRAAYDSQAIPGKSRIGVFVVSGTANRVQLVLDVFPEIETEGFPSLDQTGANSVDLHFHSDYGIYQGSIKYIYDLSGRKPRVKIRYGMLALTSSRIQSGRLLYAASSSGWSERHVTVAIQPRDGNALPVYKITDAPAPPDALPEPVKLLLPDGRTVLVSNTPPGQAHQLAGMAIINKSATREFYPAPVPTMALDRKLRPNEQAPAEIENNIGPVEVNGSTLWFANSFYDGEGTSGVGAIGAFDLRTHKFEMRYLPEIAPWSGSAIRLDGDHLWIGLMRQPEGAAYSGGLLRYNPRTGSVKTYGIPDYIYTIDRFGDGVYCGTSNGLYLVRGEEVVHMSFEPDASGELVAVSAGRRPGGRAEALAPQK